MAKRSRAKEPKTLPGLEQSTVPGRVLINLSGEMAVAINAMAARRAMSKNSVAESLIRSALLNDPSSANAAQKREDVLRYSRVLIEALQDALDYDPNRQHNRSAPELRVSDDESFLKELRKIVAELRRLNDLLESKKRNVSATRKQVISLGQHFNKFLTNNSGAFGKAAGKDSWYLLVGGIGGLLYHGGVGKDLVDSIRAHLRLPKQ